MQSVHHHAQCLRLTVCPLGTDPAHQRRAGEQPAGCGRRHRRLQVRLHPPGPGVRPGAVHLTEIFVLNILFQGHFAAIDSCQSEFIRVELEGLDLKYDQVWLFSVKIFIEYIKNTY